MKKKAVFGMTLTLLFMMSLTGLDTLVMANPIPYPALWMWAEFIYIDISLADGLVWANVLGKYPFENFGYESVGMYYPVPSDVEKLLVEMDDQSLDLRYSGRNYPTVIGVFPMIN